MNHVILSTAYLPPVTWWAIALRSRNVLLEYHETYPKQTYRNRCHIFSANGLLPLTIPVLKVLGNHTPTSDILIDNSKNWQLVHWRSIESAYSKTPYFLYYKDMFRPLYVSRFELLFDYNLKHIEVCMKILRIHGMSLSLTTNFKHTFEYPDYRSLIHPKKNTGLIGYMEFPRYIQAFEPRIGFLPNLSVIDLIFNEGPGAMKLLEQLNMLNFNEMLGRQPGTQS